MVKLLGVFILLFLVCGSSVEAKIVQANKPYTYELFERDLEKLKGRYEEEIDVKAIGTTHFGKPIWAIKIGKGKKNIVLVGTHHGREWLTSVLLMKMLESYAEAYQGNKKFGTEPIEILNDISIWFVPMLNPDGVAIQQKNLAWFPPLHQKRLLSMNEGSHNFKRWKANGMGVDLNRQYPAGWKDLNQESTEPHYRFYRGEKPLESMEVVALTKFIDEINPSIAIAYHTAGREIFWNYKNGNHLIRDYLLAKRLSKLTRYKLAKPDEDARGGGFTDWFITTYHKPAMTIEISYLVGETNPPLSVFKNEWNRNRYVGLLLAKEAKKLGN